MARMLRHKETGEVFIWTDPLSKLSELEPVIEDPVAEVIAEMTARAEVEDLVEVQVESLVEVPVKETAEAPKVSAVKPAVQRRGKVG